MSATSSPYGKADYIDGSASPVAAVASVIVAINFFILPVSVYFLWTRRGHFPLSSMPSFLLIVTQIGASLYVFSLLQSIVAPGMPCLLHILLSTADYFPFFVGTMMQLFRNWYVYNIQQSMSDQKRDQFTKHAHLVSESALWRFFIIMAAVIAPLPILQIASRSSDTLLHSPMKSDDCLSYRTSAEVR